MTDRAPTDGAPTGRDPLRDRLLCAAEGLVYSSEGDSPFAFVSLAWPDDGALTAGALAALVGAEDGAVVEERPLDPFLAPHLERSDPMDAAAQALRPRYEALKRELRAALPGVRVFRVRRPGDAEVRCYVVGIDGARGRVAGLVTTAIET